MNAHREEFEVHDLGAASEETKGFVIIGMLDSPGFGAPPPNNHRQPLEGDEPPA
jgi:hypothetical protein